MNLTNLENLVASNKLKIEPFNKEEFEGLLKSGQTRLKDAANKTLSDESRWRILTKCHDKRNLAEYEGHFEIEEQLLFDLLAASQIVLTKITTLLDTINMKSTI